MELSKNAIATLLRPGQAHVVTRGFSLTLAGCKFTNPNITLPLTLTECLKCNGMLVTVRALEAGGHGVLAGLEIRVFQKTGPPRISATDSGHNIKESKQ